MGDAIGYSCSPKLGEAILQTNTIAAVVVLALLIAGWALYRYRILKSPLSLIGWGPPWDVRYLSRLAAGLVFVVGMIVWALAPHSQVAKMINDLMSAWFR